MLIAVAVGAVVLLTAAALYGRANPFGREPTCPNCNIAFIPLPREDQPNYDVLVCPQCSNSCTTVHGGQARFAPCTSCGQRTMEVHAMRLPPQPTAPIAVEVRELCHVCSHEELRILPEFEQPRPMGKVIPFRRR